MQSRAPFIIVMATLMIDAMGIGLIMPVMPDLIGEILGQGISSAAVWGSLLSFTYAAMQFLFGPMIGGLSDRFGRRPVLMFSLIVLGIDYMIMAAAQVMWLLILARMMSGIAGATYSTATAYLADSSTREKRAANFGLVGAAFGIGFIIGPAIGGLLGELGSRAPFIAAGLLALGNAVFAYFALPETLTVENRREFQLRRANPLRALLRLKAVPAIGLLLVVDFLYVVATHVYPVIWSYFAKLQFGWSSGMVGASLATYGLTTAIVLGLVIRPILRRLGEVRTAYLGLVMCVVALVVVALIENGAMVFVLMPVIALGAIAGPAMQGMMANEVSDNEQGELQGVLASIAGIAAIISPLISAAAFRTFTKDDAVLFLPGAPFLVAAVLAVAALALFGRWRQGHPSTKT